VSSTSALDSEHYIQQSESGQPVLESDNLEGSRQGLETGYGQTKWVSEKLIGEACRRGLDGVIARPGYVMGDEKSGVSNSDDFLVRMLKGCVQVGSRPDVSNTINMVPVTHVAQKILAVALQAEQGTTSHVDAHPRLTFNEYLSVLEDVGYSVPVEDYNSWKTKVEQYVESSDAGKEELALLGLYHMVTGNLPAATQAPNLDDKNAQAAITKDEKESGNSASPPGVTKEAVRTYLAYLVARGFLLTPDEKRQTLPVRTIDKVQAEALDKVGGRGGNRS
jgi:L-2-aminoadipate reductase